MGTSKPNVDIYIPAILVSFVKIKELESIYHKKREGKLSKLLFDLIEKLQNGYIITPITEQFKDIKNKDKEGKERNQPDEIIDYIIRELDKELNDIIKIKEKDKEEEKEKKEKIKKKFFDSDGDSLIKKLFFGISVYGVDCKKCGRIWKEEEFTNKVIDLTSKKERRIDIKNFFKMEKYEIKKEITCDKCKKNYEYTIKNNYFADIKSSNIPDILIVNFKSKEKTIVKNDIDSIMKLEIKNIGYNLICFIAKVDQKNDPDEQNNVFYLKNSIWYVYKTKKNIEMKVSIPINAVPLVAFYQKDKTLFKSYYTNIISLLNDKENTLELLDEHILNDEIYDNYYIVDNKWYSKILKLYEEETNYINPKYEINSDDLNKVSKLNYIKTLDIQEMFFKRKMIFKEIPPIETEETETEDSIKYPKNFMLIKENILNYLLDIVKINNKSKDFLNNFLYKIKFGEKYAFIKDIKDEKSNGNEERFFVSIFSPIKNSFQVVVILNYNKPGIFEKEIENFISNKGGLEYYYYKRNIDVNKKGKQIIKDLENSEIGYLINIKDENTQLNKT